MPRRAPKQPIDPETLARQTALLVRARQEVKAEPERALKTLVEFEQQFPQRGVSEDPGSARAGAPVLRQQRGQGFSRSSLPVTVIKGDKRAA
jgi:hypothetical protein